MSKNGGVVDDAMFALSCLVAVFGCLSLLVYVHGRADPSSAPILAAISSVGVACVIYWIRTFKRNYLMNTIWLMVLFPVVWIHIGGLVGWMVDALR